MTIIHLPGTPHPAGLPISRLRRLALHANLTAATIRENLDAGRPELPDLAERADALAGTLRVAAVLWADRPHTMRVWIDASTVELRSIRLLAGLPAIEAVDE